MNEREFLPIQVLPYLLDVPLFALSESTLGRPVLFFPLESAILILSYETIEASGNDISRSAQSRRQTYRSTFFLGTSCGTSRSTAYAVPVTGTMLVFTRLFITAVVGISDIVLLPFRTVVVERSSGASSLAGCLSCKLLTLIDAGWRGRRSFTRWRGGIVHGRGWESSWIEGQRRIGGMVKESVEIIIVNWESVPLRGIVGHGDEDGEVVGWRETRGVSGFFTAGKHPNYLKYLEIRKKS